MADTAPTPQNAPTPENADAPASPEHLEAISDRLEHATIRRSPRYGIFLVLGAALGVFVAMILTFAFNGNDRPADNGAVYSDGQVFGFLALVGVAVGLLVGGGVALILDKVSSRRATPVEVDHKTVESLD
ncbi:potassium transporter Trk [Microbacterium sp.]|uniref:potassium transporter Trk n=1 Tax=Microbacterium sp. TaxID=51671 RepID=UPI0037C90BE3